MIHFTVWDYCAHLNDDTALRAFERTMYLWVL